MMPTTAQHTTPQATRPEVFHAPALSGELEALLAAITGAIEALVAWDITAFQSAVERQRLICERLARLPASEFSGLHRSPATAATARKIRELNRVYDRLLQHSIHWTRTLHSIMEAGGHTLPSRATVHFRG
jgi:hypothetical protein